ncbi:MAG: formylglycine-generating enzyme family protein [Phycisphaerae bacterium]|nr:formylglycine-generating enzyme family protein [Phycisphaerae bacterium]
MMQRYSTVSYRVVTYLVLLAISVLACQSPKDVEGKDSDHKKKYTETITSKNDEKISFNMVLVPGGTFDMGSPKDEPGRKEDEGPQHKVRISPFYLCTTETTIEIFMAYYQETMTSKKDFFEEEKTEKEAKQGKDDVDALTGPTPVYGDLTMGYSKKHPAMGMTWHNATFFCKWLSKKTGRKYRLPTEAEWEYACRAGSTNVFGFGNDQKQLVEFASYEANSDDETSEVARKKPNSWGLYDMLGNVREWVYDFYNPEAYKDTAKKSPAINPQGPKSGKVHVARGGDYSSSIEELRCTARAFEEEWWRSGDPQIPKSKWWLPEMDIIGFRIASSIEPK